MGKVWGGVAATLLCIKSNKYNIILLYQDPLKQASKSSQGVLSHGRFVNLSEREGNGKKESLMKIIIKMVQHLYCLALISQRMLLQSYTWNNFPEMLKLHNHIPHCQRYIKDLLFHAKPSFSWVLLYILLFYSILKCVNLIIRGESLFFSLSLHLINASWEQYYLEIHVAFSF